MQISYVAFFDRLPQVKKSGGAGVAAPVEETKGSMDTPAMSAEKASSLEASLAEKTPTEKPSLSEALVAEKPPEMASVEVLDAERTPDQPFKDDKPLKGFQEYSDAEIAARMNKVQYLGDCF